MPSRSGLPKGAVTGLNDRKQAAYHGPCPPIGRHRYFHKLYALDTMLPAEALTKAELEADDERPYPGASRAHGDLSEGRSVGAGGLPPRHLTVTSRLA